MYSTYLLSVLLLALLGNAVNAELDPSKYTVAFHFEGLGYRCAGGIISENFVLTAGECFADKWGKHIEVPKITAVAGTNDLTNDDGKVEVEVEAVFLPYHYAGRFRHIQDFAVIKLKQSLNLQKNGLIALSLPESFNRHPADVGFVSGYGVDSSEQGKLHSNQVDVVDIKKCNDAYNTIPSGGDMCIGRRQGSNVGQCSGDKGSPVVAEDGLLFGIQFRCEQSTTYEYVKIVSWFKDIINAAIAGQPGPFNTHYYS